MSTPNNKPVAVIILNWNGEALLREFLPKVLATTSTELADVIVADNGSSDGSVKLLNQAFPEVKTIIFDKNYGFAEGYNKAIELTQYKYTVLLNSDVATGKNWLEPLYNYMESHPEVGACQPKIRSYKEPHLFEYAGAAGGLIDKHGYPYCRGRLFASLEEDKGQYDTIEKIFWASGAALMIHSDLYISAGGLDKDFFAHMEEIDLCWRTLRMGRDIVVIPKSIVYHLGGGSLPASNPRKTYLNFRNNLLLLHKNLPTKSRGKILFRRRLLDTIAFFKFIATLDFANANAIIKAHRDFRKMKRNYSPQDSCTDMLKKIKGGQINILTKYYLKGKRKYSDLGL